MAAISGPKKEAGYKQKKRYLLIPCLYHDPYGHLGDYSRSLIALVASS